METEDRATSAEPTMEFVYMVLDVWWEVFHVVCEELARSVVLLLSLLLLSGNPKIKECWLLRLKLSEGLWCFR